MPRITYLVGAGASANSVPLGDQIVEEFGKMITLMSETVNHVSTDDLNYGNFQKVVNDFISIYKASEKHGSFDTYAKKLYLTGEKEILHMLKSCLSTYFLFRQKTEKQDSRYDKFWASILEKKTDHPFPSGINILTWNYDMQFKLSLAPYFKEYHKHPNFPYFFSKEHIDLDSFFIYPINGIAGPYLSSKGFESEYDLKWPNGYWFEDLSSYSDELGFELFKYFIQTFRNDKALKFAWEDSSHSNIQNILPFIEQSIALVIIGYSFPFFNRSVDKEIFKALTKIEKIYYQDSNPDTKLLYDRFHDVNNLLNNVRYNPEYIEPINNTKQFHLPENL